MVSPLANRSPAERKPWGRDSRKYLPSHMARRVAVAGLRNRMDRRRTAQRRSGAIERRKLGNNTAYKHGAIQH